MRSESKKSRGYALSALLLGLNLFFCAPVWAETTEVIGGSCETVGMSKMSTDQQNLIVCLKDTSGNLIWKSMTSGGSLCGFLVLAGSASGWGSAVRPPDVTGALTYSAYFDGQRIAYQTPTSVVINQTCNGTSLISSAAGTCGWDCAQQYANYQLACPSGYNLRLLFSGLAMYSLNSYSENSTTTYTLPASIEASYGDNYFSTWTCIKS
jgi:hypothetical protein